MWEWSHKNIEFGQLNKSQKHRSSGVNTTFSKAVQKRGGVKQRSECPPQSASRHLSDCGFEDGKGESYIK